MGLIYKGQVHSQMGTGAGLTTRSPRLDSACAHQAYDCDFSEGFREISRLGVESFSDERADMYLIMEGRGAME